MDGKPLYEYARNGLALPRPIEPRKVTVHSLELVDWKEGRGPGITGHNFKWPEKTLNAEDIAAMDRIRMLVAEAAVPAQENTTTPSELPLPPSTSSTQYDARAGDPSEQILESGPPAFTLKMVVSSGTYVRSIVHDLAHAVGSAAHVVTLTRTRQGDFGVGPKYIEKITGHSEIDPKPARTGLISSDELYGGDCVPWEVFEKALEDRDRETHVADDEHDEWEKVLLAKWHPPS
jgi:tRNA pseudouridine55 synthase